MDAKITLRVNPRVRELRDLMKLNVDDMRQIATGIDKSFTTNERRLFSTEGASGGGRWAPLSPEYARYKRRARPGRKILAFDGNLRSSLTNRNDAKHVMRWTLVPQAVVSVGTSDPKAAYHGPAAGNPLRNKTLPVRDPLQHTQEQERGYLEIAAEHFRKVKIPRLMRAIAAWRATGRRGA